MKMFLSIFKKLLFIFLLIFYQFCFAENNYSIFGKVTAKDTGAALENVIVEISYYVNGDFSGNEVKVKKVISDKDGYYMLDGLEQMEYVVTFIPQYPYIENSAIIIPSEFLKKFQLELNETLWLGGSVGGKVYLKNNRQLTPLSNVKIFLNAPRAYPSTNSGPDGSYFFGGVDPMCKYLIPCTSSLTAYSEISGIAQEFICCFKIEAGKEEKIDIVFDTDIKTGINGYVKSCLDSQPLLRSPRFISFDYMGVDGKSFPAQYAHMVSDLNGYFSMLNLPAGFYKVRIPNEDDKTECNLPSEVEVFVPEGIMKSIELFIDFPSDVNNIKGKK